MAVNILKATDPVTINALNLMVYGDPGAGKTSLAFSAETPLLLDFDAGAYRSAFRQDSVPIQSWSDIEGLDEETLAPYQTIVVDTVGRCLDILAAEIMREEPKYKTRFGQLTLQGYGALKGRFASWLASLRASGKDVVLVAHGKEERKGDELILRPDMTGGSYGEVFKLADAVGYLWMRGKERTLEWDPQERMVGKNPAQLPPVEVPDLHQNPTFLADLIGQIKKAMGSISEQGQAVTEVVDEWRPKIEAAKSAKALNAVVSEIAEANGDIPQTAIKQLKALVGQRSRDLGLGWDAEKKSFLPPSKAEQTEAA